MTGYTITPHNSYLIDTQVEYITADELIAPDALIVALMATEQPPINCASVERYFCPAAQQAARGEPPAACPDGASTTNGPCPRAPAYPCILRDRDAFKRLIRLMEHAP